MSKKRITTVYTMDRADIEAAVLAAFAQKYPELNDEHEEKITFYHSGNQLTLNAQVTARIEFVEERE